MGTEPCRETASSGRSNPQNPQARPISFNTTSVAAGTSGELTVGSRIERPRFARQPSATLSKSLNAEAARKSDVVLISYDAASPELAQMCCQPDDRFLFGRTHSPESNSRAQEFLAQQTSAIRQRLQDQGKRTAHSFKTIPAWPSRKGSARLSSTASDDWKTTCCKCRPRFRRPRPK